MSTNKFPLLLEASELEKYLHDPQILVVDMCKPETYAQYHIPGAVPLEYSKIVRNDKPVMGLLPDADSLGHVLSSLGMTRDTHVVAYDDEGGGKACRLLWTLDVIGHPSFSLLNGGLHAWANEDHTLDTKIYTRAPGSYPVEIGNEHLADKAYILQYLHDPAEIFLDTRTREEFAGIKIYAAQGGHIPGAVNMDWLLTMDRDHNLRLLPDTQLRKMLERLGVTPDKEVITYCQSHHRSSHTYILLKHLGYEKIRGYHGAWSDWGNDPDTPKEI